MYYNMAYKVPVWLLLRDMSRAKRKAVVSWLQEAEAKRVDWMSSKFKEFLMTFKSRGWESYLSNPIPFNLDGDLLMLAATELVQQEQGTNSYLQPMFGMTANMLNRDIRDDFDYDRLMNEVLFFQEDVVLSQIFHVLENCYNTDGKNYHVWYTNYSTQDVSSVLTKISNKVIKIGEDEKDDLNVKDLTKEQVIEKLVEMFSNFKQN